jgi:hypothetical protein
MNLKKIQRALKQPFSADDLEWRVQQSGIGKDGKAWAMVLAYVDNRAIMNRFDEVLGIGAWTNAYSPLPNSVGDGALCGLSIKIDGEWITKYDGADNTAVESTKGGLSGAMKRAAVLFGVGRYLYNLDTFFADCSKDKPQQMQGWEKAKTKDGTWFYWKAPSLPSKYLPQKDILPSQRETIKTMLEQTNTKIDDYLSFYGVDNFVDLYQDEAAKIINSLLRKLSKIKAEEEEAKSAAAKKGSVQDGK